MMKLFSSIEKINARTKRNKELMEGPSIASRNNFVTHILTDDEETWPVLLQGDHDIDD